MVDNVLAMGAGRCRDRSADLQIIDLVTPPVVMLALIGGVLVAGRSTTSTLHAATGVLLWFVLLIAFGARIARRRPATRLALAIGYVLAAAVALTLLGLPSVIDREVSELVATGTPLHTARGTSGTSVELAAGTFDRLAHPGAGRAAVVEVPDGRRVLTLTDFATTNGPDLHVYLAGERPTAGRLGGAVHVGALKGNRGDQQYELPTEAHPSRYPYVVVWSRAFAIGFTSAHLSWSDG
jgi:hypothetical protein